MNYKKSIELLKNHSFLHDSIVNECAIKNSARINEKNSIIFKKNPNCTVNIILSSQSGYRFNVVLSDVKKMLIHELNELIIFEVILKKEKNIISFSLTGDFSDKDTYFECGDINIQSYKIN